MSLRKKIKKTLSAIVLVSSFLTQPSNAGIIILEQEVTQEQEKVAQKQKNSQTTETNQKSNFFNVFQKQTEQRYYQKQELLGKRDFKAIDRIKWYSQENQLNNPLFCEPTDGELKEIGYFIGQITMEGLKKATNKIPGFEEAKKDVNRLTRYEVYLKGKPKKTNHTCLNFKEQERREKEDKENRTRIELFPGTIFDSETCAGIDTYLDNKYDLTTDLYFSVTNPCFLGLDYDRAKMSLDNHGQVGLNFQKTLDYDWNAELNLGTSNFSGLGKVTFSLVKQTQPRARDYPVTRLEIKAGHNALKRDKYYDLFEQGSFLTISYGIIF